MTVLRSPSALRSVRSRLQGTTRILIKEISAFGLIGALAFAMDLGIFVWLAPHGALKAKAVSTLCSTTFAYFGNRYLSFSHRARTSVGRETSFFFGINLITLIFSELALALFHYGFGFGHSSFGLLVVNLATVAVGTVFRFWAYKRFVFVHPDRAHDSAAYREAHSNADLDSELAE